MRHPVSAPCAWWAQIGRAPQPWSEPHLRAHLDGCAGCRAELAVLARAAGAIKSAPYAPPSSDAREQARTRFVAAITPALAVAPAPRRLWVRVAVAVAASLGGATVLAAVASHVVTTRQTERAAAAERARDRAPRLVARAQEETPVLAPPPVAAPPAPSPPQKTVTSPAPPRAPRMRAVAPPAPALAPPAPALTPPAPVAANPINPAEVAFNQAWDALRDGDHRAAAALMERAVAGGALDEDARYWRAIAFVRARDKGAARAAMEQFLRFHPGSRRAGEVSAMLGWLLVETGDLVRARQLFQAAASDASPGVRQSAEAGRARVGR